MKLDRPFYAPFVLVYWNQNKERQAVNVSTQFKHVNGHIEVYSYEGEFLFSADTMEEAWRELCA